MPRGAAGAAQNQLGVTNAVAGQQQQQASQLENGSLIPGYESLMKEGYTPEQKAGITTAGMGATAAPFTTAQQTAENEAARTRNTAGTAAQEDSLAQAKGVATGNEAAGLQQGFADREQQNRIAGLSGLQQLYGTNTGAMESMYGLGPSTVNAWSNAQMNNPMLDAIGKPLIGAAIGGK